MEPSAYTTSPTRSLGGQRLGILGKSRPAAPPPRPCRGHARHATALPHVAATHLRRLTGACKHASPSPRPLAQSPRMPALDRALSAPSTRTRLRCTRSCRTVRRPRDRDDQLHGHPRTPQRLSNLDDRVNAVRQTRWTRRPPRPTAHDHLRFRRPPRRIPYRPRRMAPQFPFPRDRSRPTAPLP